MNQNTYNPLMCTTTLIRFPEKPDQHATGFFYNHNQSTYLITNRHVLEHEHEQPKEISIWFRDFSDINATNRVDVDLYRNEFPRWLIHPFYPEADIAALPINQQLSHLNDEENLTGSLALSSDSFVDENIMIRGGTGARVFGYPGKYVDADSQFPVARNGMIASPYGNWFDQHPQFLVDGVMGEGMSGSPVFTKRKTYYEKIDGGSVIANPMTYLIGIHSGDYRPQNGSHSSDLNINHVWYSELIHDLFVMNGFSDYVNSVESTVEEMELNDEDSESLFSILNNLFTWELFDPERNQLNSPSDALQQQADTESISSLISLINSR
jgi:hypothetical protein